MCLTPPDWGCTLVISPKKAFAKVLEKNCRIWFYNSVKEFPYKILYSKEETSVLILTQKAISNIHHE